MPEQIRKLQDKVDNLDQKDDEKVSIGGMEEDLTKTYIEKMDDLLAKMDKVDPKETELARQSIIEELQATNAQNISDRWARFDISLEADISMLEEKIKIREKIEALDKTGWEQAGGWDLSYENLRVNNYTENVSTENVDNLAAYICPAPEIAGRFAESLAFFTEGVAQTQENNQVLKMFLGEKVVRDILSGKVTGSEELIQAFEEATQEAEKKKKDCEEFMGKIEEAGKYTKETDRSEYYGTDLSPYISGELPEELENPETFMNEEEKNAFRSGTPYRTILSRPVKHEVSVDIPKEQMIDLFAVLVEQEKIPTDKVTETVVDLIKHDEIQRFLSDSTVKQEDRTEFLMTEIPKLQNLNEKDRQKEIFKTRARILVEADAKREKAEIQKQIEEETKELQEIQKELDNYKAEFTRDGVLYANMEIMENADTSERSEQTRVGTSFSTVSFGNFRRLAKFEDDLANQEKNLIQSQLAIARNEAITTMANANIDKVFDRVFAEGASDPEKNLAAVETFLAGALAKEDGENDQERFDRLQMTFELDAETEKKSAASNEVKRLQTLIFVKQQETNSAVSENDEALKTEFECRKVLEGSADRSSMDETQKVHVVERKEAKVREIHQQKFELEKLIEDTHTEIKESIDKYGSIYLMPETERALVQEKASGLIAIVGTSLEFSGELRSLDIELRIIDPAQGGLKEDVLANLKESEIKNKEILREVSKFLGNEIDISKMEIQVLTQEMTGLILNSLNEKTGSLVDGALDGIAAAEKNIRVFENAARQRAEEATLVEADQLDERHTRAHFDKATGVGQYDIVRDGEQKYSDMVAALDKGIQNLTQVQTILNAELSKKDGVFAENPPLLEKRNEIIKNILTNIDQMIANFTKAKEQMEGNVQKMIDARNEMNWDFVKQVVILAGTVALAMATGGLASAGIGRLCSLAGMGLRGTQIAQFIGGNIAVAAGSTIGQRGVTEGLNLATRELKEVGVNIGAEYNVDWGLEGIAWDFGKSLAMSVAFTGGGRFIGSKVAKIRTSSGMTYGELSRLGLTRISWLENMANPFKIFGKGSTTGLRGVGREFMEEFVEEGIQETGESINPVLGGVLALIAGTKVGDISVDTTSPGTTPLTGLTEIGVSFNPVSGRHEFSQGSARDFGTELIAKLGEAHNALEMEINPDGSITVKQAGSEGGVTIHPKEGVQADPNLVAGNFVTTENLAHADISPDTRQLATELLTVTDGNLRLLTESLIDTSQWGALTLLGKAHRSGDQTTLKQVTGILTRNATIESYKEYGKDGIIGVAKKLNPGNKQAAMEDATFLLDKLIHGQANRLTIDDILSVDKELATWATEFKENTELTPEIMQARMAKADVEALRTGIDKAKTAEDIEALIAEIRSPAEQQMLSQAWKSLHELNLAEDVLNLDNTKAIFKESAGYLSDYLSAIEAGGFKGGKEMTPQKLFSIIEGNQRKLAYQTVVDERHITGSDHGTMHILNGDMEHSLRIADQLGLTPQQRIILRQAIIDHDMGYAQSTARNKRGDQFFGMTKDHPLYSTLMIEANREAYTEAFGQEGYDAIRTIVLNHSDTRGIDPVNRPGLELVRDIAATVDALQVTSDLKMMGLFRQPQFMAEMQKMDFIWKRVGRGEITKAEGIQLIQGIKDKMLRMINQGPFPAKLKQAYKEAIQNNLDPANTQFMINRDFAAHVGGFGGVEIDPTGKMTAKFDIYDSQALIAGIFGDGTATYSLTKAMGEFGLKEGQPVSINGETVIFDGKDFSARLKGLKMGETIIVETKKGRFEFTKKAENSENMKEFTSAVSQTHEIGGFIETLKNTEDMPQAEMSARLEQTREALSRYAVNGKKASELLAPFYREYRRGQNIDQKSLQATLENIYYNGNIAT